MDFQISFNTCFAEWVIFQGNGWKEIYRPLVYMVFGSVIFLRPRGFSNIFISSISKCTAFGVFCLGVFVLLFSAGSALGVFVFGNCPGDI